MSNANRPSVDERMNAWLNEQADQVEIPDEDRQRFIDAMRTTHYARHVRTRFAMQDVGAAIADELERAADRVDAWVKKTFPKKEDQ